MEVLVVGIAGRKREEKWEFFSAERKGKQERSRDWLACVSDVSLTSSAPVVLRPATCYLPLCLSSPPSPSLAHHLFLPPVLNGRAAITGRRLIPTCMPTHMSRAASNGTPLSRRTPDSHPCSDRCLRFPLYRTYSSAATVLLKRVMFRLQECARPAAGSPSRSNFSFRPMFYTS